MKDGETSREGDEVERHGRKGETRREEPRSPEEERKEKRKRKKCEGEGIKRRWMPLPPQKRR